jgi:hypothetical protein
MDARMTNLATVTSAAAPDPAGPFMLGWAGTRRGNLQTVNALALSAQAENESAAVRVRIDVRDGEQKDGSMWATFEPTPQVLKAQDSLRQALQGVDLTRFPTGDATDIPKQGVLYVSAFEGGMGGDPIAYQLPFAQAEKLFSAAKALHRANIRYGERVDA